MEQDYDFVIGPVAQKGVFVGGGTKGYREPEKVQGVSHNLGLGVIWDSSASF